MSKRLAKWLISSAAALGMCLSSQAAKAQENVQDVYARVTVDNAYMFAFGTKNAIAENSLSLPVFNDKAEDISGCISGHVGAEEYTVQAADEDTYLYLIAWSDHTSYQGALAHFELLRDQIVIATGEAGWEVFATGIRFNSDNLDAPSLESINEQIAVANQASGASDTTSVTWVGRDGAPNGIGVLEIGDHIIENTCPPMPAGTEWMWYDPDSTDEYSSLGKRGVALPSEYYNEYLIFRVQIRTTPLDVDVTTDCAAAGADFNVSVRSGGAIIDRVWYEMNGTETDLCNGNCGADYQTTFSRPEIDGTLTVFAVSSEADVFDDSDTVTWSCEIPVPELACVHGATLVDVRNDSLVHPDITAGSFSAQAQVGPTLMKGNVSSSGDVFMGSYSEIEGVLTLPENANLTIQNDVVIGDVVRDELSFPALSTRSFAYGGNDFNLWADDHRSLPPGQWNTVNIGSRSLLTIVSGRYGLGSLHIDTDAHVILDTTNGPIEINVEGDVEIKSRVEFFTIAQNDASLVSWYTNGDFTVYDDVVLRGSVLAPHGNVMVSDRNEIYGCLAGDVVVIDNVNEVIGFPYVGWPNDTCTDGLLNGDETDVDCGGSCAKCELNRQCNVNADCVSDYCNDGTCAVDTTSCNAATAIDLGAPWSGMSVAADACVKVVGPLEPWAKGVQLQPYSGSGYPIPLSYESCSESGTSELLGDWQQLRLDADANCTTVIELQGSSSDAVALKWWPVG